MNDDGPRNRVKALEKTFSIVESLEELDGGRVTEVATHLDYPPSTVHSHLSTLEHWGLVVKEGDEYHVGLRWLTFGGYAITRKDEYTLAVEKTKEIARTTGERAQFVVEEHGRGIYVATETGEAAVQIDARIGKRNFLHASAAGKAILAHCPSEKIDAMIDRWGLKSLTEQTITERDALEAELAAVRERGYSMNDGESISGLRAVGASIRGANGEVIGSISVSGPSNRLTGARFDDELPSLLQGVTNEIELKLEYGR